MEKKVNVLTLLLHNSVISMYDEKEFGAMATGSL